MKRIKLVGLGSLLGIIAVAFTARQYAAAEVVENRGPFQVTFHNNGEKDADPYTQTISEQDWANGQITDVLESIDVWTSRIANVTSRPINLHVYWKALSGQTVGSTSNPIIPAGNRAWTSTERIWQGGDSTYYNIYYDAKFIFDTDGAGTGWNFGTGSPGANQVDFRSVIAHEIGHVMGVMSTFGSDGTWSSAGLTAWDSYLHDDAGNRASAGGFGTPGDFNEQDNPVWFDGPHAKAANGGNDVGVWAPVGSERSSLTHLDELSQTHALMSPFVTRGEVIRGPTDLEWAIMQDLGWQVAPVPEPGATVMLAGLCAAGFVWLGRRRYRCILRK